jgi:hypothetical protein
MSINQYRRVCYEDDGCDRWQCLSCYKEFVSYDNPEWSKWNFCPHCGTKWAGKRECRDHYTPRWQYELEQDGICVSAPDRASARRSWVIEKRTVFWQRDDEKGGLTLHTSHKSHPGASDWHTTHTAGFDQISLRDVVNHLRSERDTARERGANYLPPNNPRTDWGFGAYDEFRARIVNTVTLTPGYRSSIWTHRTDEKDNLVTVWNKHKTGWDAIF